MNIPNLEYKSLDVSRGAYTLFFSKITNFVIELTLGHVVTLPMGQVVTLLGPTMEQIVRIFGVNRANCDTSTKVGMRDISIGLVIKYILSDS